MFLYQHLPDGSRFSPPVGLEKYKCLILSEHDVAAQTQKAVSKALVTSGCLYAMSWGVNSRAWEDELDGAFLDMHGTGDWPADELLITTNHGAELLEEVIAFAKRTAKHARADLHDILVLDFGAKDRKEQIETLYDGS